MRHWYNRLEFLFRRSKKKNTRKRCRWEKHSRDTISIVYAVHGNSHGETVSKKNSFFYDSTCFYKQNENDFQITSRKKICLRELNRMVTFLGEKKLHVLLLTWSCNFKGMSTFFPYLWWVNILKRLNFYQSRYSIKSSLTWMFFSFFVFFLLLI